MGKRLKKGRAPPSGKRHATKQSVKVTERRSCVHFDKCVNLDKLLTKIKSCQQIKCGECKEGEHVKRSEGKVISENANEFSFSAKNAIWLCLECGHYLCGGVGLPIGVHSHVVRHIRSTRHRLVIQCENTQLRWCFACQSLLPFEKEENGEKKDMLLEAVKLIKERYSNTCSASTETEDSCSGNGSSIFGEITLQGSAVSTSLEARDGYAVRGLVNLGNTCFFNSVLQNLLYLDLLRDHLLKEEFSCGGPLVSSLKVLLAETKSDAGLFKSVINPRDLLCYVCSMAPQFWGYQQHDSHELLRCLMDGLSIEELSLRKKLDVSYDSDDSSSHQKPTFIDSIFRGEISSTVSCLECGYSSKVYETFLDLSLPVPSKKPPPEMQQTLSQEKGSEIPPETVLKNVADSKDSEIVSAMALYYKQVPEIITETDTEDYGFWFDTLELEFSDEETDLVSQGNVSETAPLTQAEGVDQTFVGRMETLMHENDASEKPETVPDKEDARAMQCGKYTASSVTSYADLGKSASFLNPLADGELPLLVADSQVLCMPYKDDISYGDKTVAEGKGETFSSYVSGQHEQTVDYVDFSWFFDDPTVSCDEETVKECEGQAPSSLVSGHHEQTVDYVDFFSWFFDEPDVSCGDEETVKECEGQAPSSHVSGHHEQTIDHVDDLNSFFDEPEGPVFGPPPKAEVLVAAFMAVSSNSDAEVLDHSDSPVSVDRCLAQFTKPEILSEDNAWHCENCSNNLKLQRLSEKINTKEGLGNGWVNENGASLASDVCRDNPPNQSFIDLEDWETIHDSEEVVVKTAATKRVLVNKAPPVLTIHLKRFSQDACGRLSKLSGHVDFKEFIDLGQYMDMDSRWTEEDQPVYMLAGLVEHSGTMERGHYVAYVRGDDKERSNSPDSSIWYRASDSYVRQVSFEEVLRSEAYILFYQRI